MPSPIIDLFISLVVMKLFAMVSFDVMLLAVSLKYGSSVMIGQF